MLKDRPMPPLLSHRGQLKYVQLKNMLLDQISSGRLQPGDMLPPEVDIAQQMGVARNTVRQAMRELELQQTIRRVRGKGTIVCDVPGNSLGDERTKTAMAGQLFGLVLPELRAGMYQSLQAGMNHAMTSVSANMVVCDSGQEMYRQIDGLLQLAHRGVSGITIVPITTAATPVHHLSLLRANRMPLVFCHRRVEGVRAPLVGFSPYEMGRVAGQELARQGHRRLAMIFSHASASCDERKRGARDAVGKVKGQVPEEFIYYDTSFRADMLPPGLKDRLAEQLQRMLADPEPPTGIIVSADSLGAMTCHVLQQLGHSVPGDVSVIGFGDLWNRQTVLPCKLTSVTVDEWRLGQIAFETLLQIQRGERPLDDEEEIMMPLEISEGDSVTQART